MSSVIYRERTIAYGTRKVRLPDQHELDQVVASLGGKKRTWVWEHDNKEIAYSNDQNYLQLLFEQITGAHDGVFRLYHDALPNIPQGGAEGKTLAYQMNLKVSDVYNFVFDNATDLDSIMINMPRSVKGVSDIQWVYQAVPSIHQETESLLYLKEMFRLDDQAFIQLLDGELRWRLYGLKKQGGGRGSRYVWTSDGTMFLDSDGLPPSSAWLINQVNTWADFDKPFEDNLLLLFELKTHMMPYAFKMMSSQTGDLILDRPMSGLYCLLTRRNRAETTPWVVQMSQEVQVLDRHANNSLSKHVIDHGSFLVVQFIHPAKQGGKLQPSNVVLSAPSQRQVYWHVMAVDEIEKDQTPDQVVDWLSSQNSWDLGQPVHEGQTYKLTNDDRAKTVAGLLICALEYYNTTRLTNGNPVVPTNTADIVRETFGNAIKRNPSWDDSFTLVVPGVSQEQPPVQHTAFVRRLITTVYLPPVCTSPILEVEPVRVATPDQVKLVIPEDVDRSQMFNGIRNQIIQEQKMEQFPGGGRSTPIIIAIQRILNNRKNASDFLARIKDGSQLEKMSRAQLALHFGLHSLKDDTDAFWYHPVKKEYVAIHPGRMEGIKLFDMDPRKGLTQQGAIWLRSSPELAQLGVDQFLVNLSYEPLLYRALELTVRQNELLAKQRSERMVRFGLSTSSYATDLTNRGGPKSDIMLQRLDSLDRLYRMLYQQDIGKRISRLPANEIDVEYVKPLLNRPEKEHREFARQFWELPIRLFPNHITCWDTRVSFLTQDEIGTTLWSIGEFAPTLIEREHAGLPDPAQNPSFLRLFWIKMYLESTPEEQRQIKDKRSTFYVDGRMSKAKEFNDARTAAFLIGGQPINDFFAKYMFQTIYSATIRNWPNGVMPLFESNTEELSDALHRGVITPDQIPASNPNKENAVSFYQQVSAFIDDGQTIAIRALGRSGAGLAETKRAQAWLGYQSLVLANINQFWGPDSGRVSLVDCQDGIPVIARTEHAMVTLGLKKKNEDGQQALDLLDTNMLLIIDEDWDDPAYHTAETGILYALIQVDDDLKKLAEQIQDGLEVRKKIADYYQQGVNEMERFAANIVGFRNIIKRLIVMMKKDYATFLEQQVKQQLTMETIRKVGTNLAFMTKPGSSFDNGQKRGRKVFLYGTNQLKLFNDMTLRAIDAKAEFEQLWERVENRVSEYADQVLEEFKKKVMDEETIKLREMKSAQLVYYITLDNDERAKYEKKMMDESKSRMLMNAAGLAAQKKKEEDKDKPVRLLDEFEKTKQIGAGLDAVHPLDEPIPDITARNNPLAMRLKAFYDYVAERATNLSKFRDSFTVFNGLDLDDNQMLGTFFDPTGEAINVLYLLASDKRYNRRLVQNATQPGLTLGHIIFHRFVHIVTGLFIIVEQNSENIKGDETELMEVRNDLRNLIADATKPLKDDETALSTDRDEQVSKRLEEKIRTDPMGTLNETVAYIDKLTKTKLSQKILAKKDWFTTADEEHVQSVLETAYHQTTKEMYNIYYQPNYNRLVSWLTKYGEMQKNSFMRRADITPMQSRFFRPNANEPSGLSAAVNTFLGMDPDKTRDQTSLSRMVWALQQDKLQEADRKNKQDEEEKKEYMFLRPLCGRAEDKGDVDNKAKRAEMTQDMLCPRTMLDLANAGLMWAITDFYKKGPAVVEQIPQGSFSNLISRLLDSVEFLNMRMRFGLDPSMDSKQHVYAYKLGSTMTDDDQNPFITLVGVRDLDQGGEGGYTEIDEEFARSVLNEIEAEQKGALKPLMDMTPRYNMTRDAAHELWRLALFGRITSPHVVWTKETMKLKDGLLLLDFLVELDKQITAAVKKDEALSSFQPLPVLQSVWAFLKFYIMPRHAYEIVFLQQLHQDGRIIYDYFSPYAVTSLLCNQFTYNLKEISPEPITWQWVVKHYSLKEPFALPEETFVGLVQSDQLGARMVFEDILENFVFFYTGEQGKGEPYQRIMGQWDRSHNPFDPSTDLITGSGFVYTRDERWKQEQGDESPWITVSPFAGLDTTPRPPEFPHGRDASYNVNTTMFETEEDAAIYEWRVGNRLYMRPSVFNANFFRRNQEDFFDWRLGSTSDLISNEISLRTKQNQWHLWPVLIAENHSLIRWYNEWERKLDNHPSLLGFHRLFSANPLKPLPPQESINENILLGKRKEQLEKVFKARIDTLKKKIMVALDEFQTTTQVQVNVTTRDLLGETLEGWEAFQTPDDEETKATTLNERMVAKLNNEITKAEQGFSDFSARLKEWADVFSLTFRQNEWIENNPDVTGFEEDPSILAYYYREYSVYSPFPAY